MNRSVRWLFVAAPLAVAACASNPPPPPAPPAPPPLAQQDQMFINFAARSDAFEIQTSQVAQQKARSPRVKDLAQKLVSDHQQADQQLMQLAQTKGFTPDATLTQQQQAVLSRLSADRPAAFDRDYLRAQIQAHDDAITQFQNEVQTGQDNDLKSFAQSTVPTLQQHLDAARALAGGGGRATARRAAHHS
jgi:putative membrane protein